MFLTAGATSSVLVCFVAGRSNAHLGSCSHVLHAMTTSIQHGNADNSSFYMQQAVGSLITRRHFAVLHNDKKQLERRIRNDEHALDNVYNDIATLKVDIAEAVSDMVDS